MEGNHYLYEDVRDVRIAWDSFMQALLVKTEKPLTWILVAVILINRWLDKGN